jgi:hypothetical protein
MSKNVDFEIGTIVTDTFLDSVQELLTGTTQNIRLAQPQNPLNTDRISLALSGDTMFDKRGAVNIEGRYCFIDQTQDSDPSPSEVGPVERNVYLSTSANGATKQPNFNITVGSAPPVDSYVKRIGEVTKSGSVLSNARMITGVQADHEQYNHITFRSVYDLPSETILTVDGQSLQTSTAGVLYDSDVSTAPTKALSVGENGNEHLYLDTAGRLVFKDDGSGDGDVGFQFTNHAGESVITTNAEFSPHIPGENTSMGVDWGFTAYSTRAIDVDVANRIEISNTGVICWGDGTLAPDVCLYRVGPDELSLATGDKLYMDYTILDTDTGDIVTNKEYVDNEIADAISESKRFAFFITP